MPAGTQQAEPLFAEEAEELGPDYAKATADEKKRMVWDARNFLEEQEDPDELSHSATEAVLHALSAVPEPGEMREV